MEKKRNAYRHFIGEPERKRSIGKLVPTQNEVHWRAVVNTGRPTLLNVWVPQKAGIS
jgi:hypothetical protein